MALINLFENTYYPYDEILSSLDNNRSFLNELESLLKLNWDLKKWFYSDDKENDEAKQHFINFEFNGFHINNYIGIIKFKNIKFVIYPKVFKKNKDDTKPDTGLNQLLTVNLREWVSYYLNLKYPYPKFLKITSAIDNPEDVFKELFISIFANYLVNTLNKNGYFKYEERTNDLSYITGRFDVQDYLCNKYPNGMLTKFKCTYSSFEFDNLLNQILKYTCKKLIKETKDNHNELALHQAIAKLSEVSDCKFRYQDCDKVKIDKIYSDYQILLLMCKMFLLNLSPSYDNEDSKSFCFLFPSELLFEAFVSGFIQEHFSNDESKIKLQNGEKYLIDKVVLNNEIIGNNIFHMFLDILYENKKSNKKYILDAKYKLIDSFISKTNDQIVENIKVDVKQPDLYQLIAYAIKWNTTKVYLLYPQSYMQKIGEKTLILKCEWGDEKNIEIGIVKVPYVFLNENDLKEQELRLVKIIKHILN